MSTQPTPTPAPDESLRTLLRGELERSKTAHPLALIDKVMPTLSTDDIAIAARYGVGRMLSEEARHLRRLSMSQPDPYDSAGVLKSPRWHGAAQASAARPDIFAARIVVGIDKHGNESYAFLRDCSKPMLREAASILRERGDAQRNALHAQADRYEALGRKLRGGALVGSLPKAVVEGVLDQ